MKAQVVLLLLVIFTIPTMAQNIESNIEGLYLSAKDFTRGHIGAAGKVRVGNKTVTVIENGRKTAYPKGRVFGFRDSRGTDFRLYKGGNKKLEILENKALTIYRGQEPGGKKTSFKPISSYYFSVGINGPIEELTLDNLKNRFQNNDFAFDQIDTRFQDERDVAQYDVYHQMFRINYALKDRRIFRGRN